MCVIHHKQTIMGTLPTAISLEFKKEVDADKIGNITENIESVISKYFSDFDMEVDSFDEFGLDLNLEINLSGKLDYIEATREEPPEEDIRWTEDYDTLLNKVQKELKKNQEYDFISIFKNDWDIEICPCE